MQVLSGIIGRKAFVGGKISLLLNPGAQLLYSDKKLFFLRMVGVEGIPSVAVKCVDIRKTTKGEGILLGHF